MLVIVFSFQDVGNMKTKDKIMKIEEEKEGEEEDDEDGEKS